MTTTAYSVVVPTIGGRTSLPRCLDAIFAQTRPPAEVIVVVAADGAVAERDGVVVERAPASTAGQRNAGVRRAGAAVVLFVDDDVTLEPDFAEAMLGLWDADPSLAGVTGTVSNDGWDMRVSRRLLRALLGQSHVALLSRRTRLMASGNVAFLPFPPTPQPTEFAGTAAVSYRRDLLLEEPFDEQFDGYVWGEDLDLSARIARRGRLLHTPDARCLHEGGMTGRHLGGGERAARLRGRVFALYRGRHRAPGLRGRIAWEWATAAEAAILAVHSIARRDPTLVPGFLSGVGEARAQLRAERGSSRSSRRP